MTQEQPTTAASKDQELEAEPATPLPTMEQLVDDALVSKDLGNTGFVTVRELKTALQESAQVIPSTTSITLLCVLVANGWAS